MQSMEQACMNQQQEQNEKETEKKTNFAGKIELEKCVVRLIFKSDRFIIIK